MPISISGPSIVRYFLEKKVYWAVFFAEFGLDLKIVRYLMGGINHTSPKTQEKTQNSRKKLNVMEDCPSLDLPSGVKKRAWCRARYVMLTFN